MIKRVLCVILTLALTVGLFSMVPLQVSAASEMTASQKCMDYLKSMESFSAIPFWDYSQWTVGFGNRCPDEHLERYKKEGIPMDEAEALFAKQLSGFAREVAKFAQKKKLSLTQNQFDALVCLSYNRGGGWLYTDNALVDALVKGDTNNTFIAEMTSACAAGGKFLAGLMRRRLTEVNMFINGVYSLHAPDNYCYVVYDAGEGKSDRIAQGYDCNLYAVPLAVPTYAGYTFLGWYTAPDGGVKVTVLDENTTGMTLYAHWEKGTDLVAPDVPAIPEGAVKVKVTGDVVNVRKGPGINYSIIDTVTEGMTIGVTHVKDVNGELWGKFDKGWICLRYTDYKPDDSGNHKPPVVPEDDKLPELPLYATVIGVDTLPVYKGPHDSYPQVATLNKGQRIEIVEFYMLFGVLWGRCEAGWVRTDRNLLVEIAPVLAHSFEVTITYQFLKVRSGPGTQYTHLDTVYRGTKLTVLSVEKVNDAYWGRTARGWICMTDYTDFNSAKLPQYQNHNFGPWKQTQAPTCSQDGEESRTCSICGHKETRKIPKGEHKYGGWHQSKAPTCTTEGEEYRECSVCHHKETRVIKKTNHQYNAWHTTRKPTCTQAGEERRECKCGHYETRSIAATGHAFGKWIVVKKPTCTSKGEEYRECKCGHRETRVIPATGHAFGDWHVTKAPTYTQKGEERRECKNCKHFETREIPCKPKPVEKTYGTLVGNSYLNIRAGLGTGYKIVGKLHKGDRVEILEKANYGGNVWGRIDRGWICLTGYMKLETVKVDPDNGGVVPKPPVDTVTKTYGTLTGYDYLNIRAGAGVGYALVGKLNYGDRVEIFEQVQVGGSTWGRIKQGWINLTGYMTLETVQEPVHGGSDDSQPVTKTYGTLTGYHYLNIRAGAGVGYALVGKLNYGDRVEIFEQVQVGGSTWGRIKQGWINLTGYMTLETVTK